MHPDLNLSIFVVGLTESPENHAQQYGYNPSLRFYRHPLMIEHLLGSGQLWLAPWVDSS